MTAVIIRFFAIMGPLVLALWTGLAAHQAAAQSASTTYYIPDQTNPSTTQAVTPKAPLPVGTKSSALTIVPLDVSSVTTGGTAVTALNAGHATAGGFIVTANAAGICVDQRTTAGTATGTPSSTTCVAQNQVFNLVPNPGAVSVNSTASSVPFGGEGLQ